MDKSREELEKEYAEATAKLEQYQHRGQRYENRIATTPKAKGRSETTDLSPVAERWRVSPRRCAA